MRNNKPPFEITNRMITEIAEISELLGKLSLPAGDAELLLRRENRIRTVQGTLAIEQNTLSLEQVTAVLNGKHIIAPPKDIAEVRNAYEIYEHLDELDPYSEDDLLKAHGIMMRGLTEDAGEYRAKAVGVADAEGRILHFGALPRCVPDLMTELLEWTERSDVHILIRSCVFHYEFELIHPFSDGNGRMGRLWHTLLLSRWNPLFAWLPVESMIYAHQAEYYAAINASNDAGESTAFIEFMLSILYASLMETAEMRDGMRDAKSDAAALRRYTILTYLGQHETVSNGDVRALLNVSAATANRVLKALTEDGTLCRVRVAGHWAYRKTE